MPLAYIQLGSNVGNKLQQLQNAILQISNSCGLIEKKSSVYETAAWGNTNQENFYNQVVIIKTYLSPEVLLEKLMLIEQIIGRVRTEKYAPRTIDLDILFYGNQIIETTDLQIPHPHLHKRKFVLVPLVELVPKKLHPVFKKSLGKLLEDCEDMLQVIKLSEI